jgi:hypothetical protein
MALFIIRSSPKRIKHVKGLLRAGAYVVGLSVLCGAFQIRSARAEMADRTLQLGRQMLSLANAAEHDVNKVVLNGQNMFIGNSLSHDSARIVLDRYQSYCEANSAQPAEMWRELANKPGASTDKKWLSTGVMRGGDDREGTVVCFTKTPKSKQSLGEAAKTFAETGDLGHLGAARYVYAKTTEQGNTHVLTAWTDDTFSIFELVGDETKDVPGVDFAGGIPRVPSSRRAFSARLDDSPFGVNVYQAKEEPAKIAQFYDDAMQTTGWVAIDPELNRREPGNPGVARLYEKDNVVVTFASVRASEDPKDGSFTVLGLAGVNGIANGPSKPGAEDPSGAPGKRALK